MSSILLQNISDIFYDNLSCIPELYPVKSYGAMYMLVRNSSNCNGFMCPCFIACYIVGAKPCYDMGGAKQFDPI